MPEAVQAYVDSAGDLADVRSRQADLVSLCEDDIAKRAEEQCNGGTVWYLPLYMLPLVAEEAKGKGLHKQSDADIDWISLLEAT